MYKKHIKQMKKHSKFSVYIFFTLFLVSLSLNASAQDGYFTSCTVAQDGSGDFTTIQAAIDACKSFPDTRITIHIKNGIYKEKILVPEHNTMLTFIGEDAEKTVITWGDYFGSVSRGKNSTFYTYTMMVEANDFIAENLTIENSAGPVGQAVALNVTGDRCVFRNCRFLGNQDTLYTAGQNSRGYFENCYIEGTTDFIFGAATVLFNHCTIHSKSNSYITAASTPQGKAYGYVFMNCTLTAADGVNSVYLGRPWRDYARTVFINCNIGAHIRPEGWSNWKDTQRDKSAYYAEYKNTGPGASTGKRVAWSHQLTKKEAKRYSVEKILAPTAPCDRESEFRNMVSGKR
jgi:pectinesterase